MDILKENESIKEDYTALAKKYGLKPAILKDVAYLLSKGLSDVDIASRLGISRITVGKYSGVLKTMDDGDFSKLIFLCILLVGGLALLGKIGAKKDE